MMDVFADIKVGDYVELSKGQIGTVEKVTAKLFYADGFAFLRSTGRRHGHRWDYARPISKSDAEARLKALAEADHRDMLRKRLAQKVMQLSTPELEDLMRHFDDKQKHPVLRNG